MTTVQVEGVCHNLSALLKNTIRNKILKPMTPPQDHRFGAALVFWTADLLAGTKLLTPEQLRLWLEEFADSLVIFGCMLEESWHEIGRPNLQRLPTLKIGFLDRQLACMDGEKFFLNLKTGEREPATAGWPLETIAFNLTALFVRYYRAANKLNSAELETNHAQDEHP